MTNTAGKCVTTSIKNVLLVDCQDTVKHWILGYFLNTKYLDEKCHTTQHYPQNDDGQYG